MKEMRFVVWFSIAQLIVGGALYYSFAVIAGPMERDLGWTKPEIYGALTLGLVVSGLSALPVGAWMDRYGGFWPMTLGSIAGGLLMVAWAFVETLPQFYALWVAMGMAFACSLYDPAFAVVAANVRDWRRGILTMTLIGGFSITVFVPLMHYLNEAFGWRNALIVTGCLTAITCGSINFYWLRGARAKGVAAEAADATQTGSALAAASRRPAFWGLGFVYIAYNFAIGVVTFHLIGLLGERGVDPDTIVLVWAAIGPMQVVGRLTLMVLGARVDGRLTARVAIFCLLMAMALLVSGIDALVPLLAFAAIYGIGNGLMTIVRGTIVPELFGPRDYATVNGALALPFNLSRALAPGIAAALWRISGGYDGVTLALFAALSAAFVAIWLVTIRK